MLISNLQMIPLIQFIGNHSRNPLSGASNSLHFFIVTSTGVKPSFNNLNISHEYWDEPFAFETIAVTLYVPFSAV